MRAFLVVILIALAGPAAAGEYGFPEIGLTVRFPEQWRPFSARRITDPAKDTLTADDVSLSAARDPRLRPILQLSAPPAPGVTTLPSVSIFLIRHSAARAKSDPRLVLRKLAGLKLLGNRNFELLGTPRLATAGETLWFRADARYRAPLPGPLFHSTQEETWVRGSRSGYLVVDVRTAPEDEASRIGARAIIAAIALD